ncbi:AlbA family DNA-binding domain-containing protein [Rhizobium leguminosarum]|jgi:Putative DNA-binding domain
MKVEKLPMLSSTLVETLTRPVQTTLTDLIVEYGWSERGVLDSLMSLREIFERWGIQCVPAISEKGLDDERVLAKLKIDDPTSLMRSEIAEGENANIEWKETLLLDVAKHLKAKLPPQECFSEKVLQSSLKTIAAFLNTSGGTLLIGVADQGTVTGIERDFPLLPKPKKLDFDEWELHFRTMIEKHFHRGRSITSSIQIYRCPCAEGTVARVVVGKRKELCFMKGEAGADLLYVRTGNRTLSIPLLDIEQYFELEKRFL